MQVGDIVRGKFNKDIYGTVAFSSFGLSVHYYADNMLCKTLGRPVEYVAKFWEVVPMPEGYKIGLHGGLIKDDN
jgi:hypothetical protein